MTQHSDLKQMDTASWITLRWVRGTRYYRVHLDKIYGAGGS